MKGSEKLFLGLFIFVIVLGIESFTFGQEKARGVTSDSIRIGIGAPLTKALANAGRQSVAAMSAYVSHVNETGGIHGKKIVLVVDDTQLDPGISLGIFKKQITSDNVFAHISWGSPAASPLINPANEEKIPLVVLGTAKSFFVPPKKYAFCFLPPYELQTAVAVTYIHDKLNKKDAKIAIFWRNDDYGKTALVGGEEAAKYFKYEVVAKPSYILGQAIDFTSEVMKIKRAKAEFVLLGSSVGDVAGFLREAKSQKLNATIIGALSPCSERKIIYQAGDAAENYLSVFTNAMFKESNIPGVKKMLEVSKKYVSNEILAEESYYYLFAFHPMMIIVEALKRAGVNPTAENFITKGLETIKEDSGEGLSSPVSFSANKHYIGESSFMAKANMATKDFDRVSDWMKPPQALTNQIVK